ncbi:MAG: class I SAM-dependent rRNA methyltransferase [Rhodobacterales bacterium]|nr:class I SAM-dependent rRNA methyltransferase [Rhodobacterales bacterium]
MSKGSIRQGIRKLRMSRSTLVPVSMGSPWVFRDGLTNPKCGAFVELTDDNGRVVAWGLGDDGPISIRVLGRQKAPDVTISELLKERISMADEIRVRMVPPETNCWRAIHGAGDGLPGLVVDRYGSLAVLRVYSKGWERHLEAVVEAIASLPWVASVLRRYGVNRVDGRKGADLLYGAEVPHTLVVKEEGMKLLVRPYVGQKTGLFLDQREHRSLVRRFAADRDVANLFAYNGGFSIAAALGGATRVTTVDIAPDAIDDAREIFRLNGLDPNRHGFEVADVFEWTPANPVDLLIVDPPALTRGARSDGAARSAYKRLHNALAPYVTRNGLLATASCSARLPLAQWRLAVHEGIQKHGDWSWHWCSIEPPDHPTAVGHKEGHYLKFGILRRR